MAAKLNGAGERFASQQISAGKVNTGTAWSWDTADEDAILSDPPDWTAYGKHFLGIDATESRETKAHWKYPFAKGNTVYRAGLIAIRQRASQQNATGIFDAAGRLLNKIDGTP